MCAIGKINAKIRGRKLSHHKSDADTVAHVRAVLGRINALAVTLGAVSSMDNGLRQFCGAFVGLEALLTRYFIFFKE